MNCCEYCNKEFSSKGTLVRHQKTTKSCLSRENTPGKLYQCQYCNQDFTQMTNLKRHVQNCFVKPRLDNEKAIENLKEKYRRKISELKKYLICYDDI